MKIGKLLGFSVVMSGLITNFTISGTTTPAPDEFGGNLVQVRKTAQRYKQQVEEQEKLLGALLAELASGRVQRFIDAFTKQDFCITRPLNFATLAALLSKSGELQQK
jgi:hypothetical protein